jgi:hypothetical protein
MKCRQIIFLSVLALGISAPVSPAAAEIAAAVDTAKTGPQVRYNAVTDQLSLDASGASLTGLLQRIARQSGVEILVDPAVERNVTLHIDQQPLEQGIRNLTRGLNTILVHDIRDVPGKGAQNLLVGIKLLPAGQTNTARLVPVLSPEAEALARGSGKDPAGKFNTTADERRAARLAKLPPEQRERLEQAQAKKDQQDNARKAAQAERRAQRKQEKLARLNERLQKAQASAGGNPERNLQEITTLQQKISDTQADLNGTASPKTR